MHAQQSYYSQSQTETQCTLASPCVDSKSRLICPYLWLCNRGYYFLSDVLSEKKIHSENLIGISRTPLIISVWSVTDFIWCAFWQSLYTVTRITVCKMGTAWYLWPIVQILNLRTLDLCLNWLSSHFATCSWPPNGMTGMSCRSRPQ